jgi:hypothetical protein
LKKCKKRDSGSIEDGEEKMGKGLKRRKNIWEEKNGKEVDDGCWWWLWMMLMIWVHVIG